MGREDLVSRIKDYCETMGSTAPIDVEMACNRLAKTNSAFIPSAGQVYSAAQENAARRTERLVEQTPKQLRYDMPPEKRDEMQRRFQALVDELSSGASFNSEYGALRPGEKPRAQHDAVIRTVPGSWLEEWERNNNRQYYGLKEAAE